MSVRLSFIIVALLPNWLNAQVLDSLRGRIKVGTPAEMEFTGKMDSVQYYSMKRYLSIKHSYDSISTVGNDKIQGLKQKIDSLATHNVDTDKFMSKLDSLRNWKDENLKSLDSKVEELKASVSKKIESLHLPPELQEKADKVTSAMSKLEASLSMSNPLETLDIVIPNATDPMLGQALPDIGLLNPTNVLDDKVLQDVANFNIQSVDVGDIGSKVQEYQNQVSQLPKDIGSVTNLAEEQAESISAVTDVKKELGQVDKLTEMASTLQDQEELKKQLTQEVQRQAVDHFAGKGEQLEKAMKSVSKYKQKFPTISSLNDLPKKRPNEMNGKPLIERIVPGIAMQLQKENDDVLVDFNLYFGYRFTRRFTSGAGWNQRIGYNTDSHNWCPEDARIFGPRVFSEYKLGKGFSPRLELEVMNTFVPPYIKTIPVDPGSREWVGGAFVGMKKDYTLYKKVKGTAMVMLRLFDPDRKSPYADVVNARFGFELPMRKKAKTG